MMTVAAKRKLKAERPRTISAHEAEKKHVPSACLICRRTADRKRRRRAQRAARKDQRHA